MINYIELFVIFGGIYSMGMAFFHFKFWKMLPHDTNDVKNHSTNYRCSQLLHFSFAFIFLLMAFVSVFHHFELLYTGLGFTLLIAFNIFWLFRAFEQILFLNSKERFSVLFFILFLLGNFIYLVPILFI